MIEDKNEVSKNLEKAFTKKIGNTTYDESFHYSQQSRESMNDKIIRLSSSKKKNAWNT